MYPSHVDVPVTVVVLDPANEPPDREIDSAADALSLQESLRLAMVAVLGGNTGS
jgi:hypothetical protein